MYSYKAIKINGVKVDVHRFVMEKFIGRKLKRTEIVHHIDGNKLNNTISNLEIMTLSQHSAMHATELNRNPIIREQKRRSAIQSNLTRYKKMALNRDQVLEIIKVGKTKTQKELSSIYNVHKSTISRILGGKAWAEITQQ